MTYHLYWADIDGTTGERVYKRSELGTAIEAFARVTRYSDTMFVRLDNESHNESRTIAAWTNSNFNLPIAGSQP